MTNRGPELRDVIAGRTAICKLDAPNSEVSIFGHNLAALAEKYSYEEIAYLTLTGELPAPGQSIIPAPNVDVLERVWRSLQLEPRNAHSMGLLRSAMSTYGNHMDARGHVETLEDERQAALALVGDMSHLIAQVGMHMAGKTWAPPSQPASFAATILAGLSDVPADDVALRAFEVALIVYVEHELNASTFTVRVGASTHSDLYSALIAGECILRGPRHGRANEDAMEMLLDEGGEPDKVPAYLDAFFSKPGARLPGFGNAVYNLPNSHDPRAAIQRPWLKRLSERKEDMRWYDTIVALESYMAERMKPRIERGAPNAIANVDLLAAPIYYLMGIPAAMYTPLFAAARIPGWASHYLEARYINKEALVRPRAEYTGK